MPGSNGSSFAAKSTMFSCLAALGLCQSPLLICNDRLMLSVNYDNFILIFALVIVSVVIVPTDLPDIKGVIQDVCDCF